MRVNNFDLEFQPEHDGLQLRFEAEYVADKLVKSWHNGNYQKRLRQLIADALIEFLEKHK